MCTGLTHGMFTKARKMYLMKSIVFKHADSNAEMFRIFFSALCRVCECELEGCVACVSENLLHCSTVVYYTSPTHPVTSAPGTGLLVFIRGSLYFSCVLLVEG